jgi:transient receptor potential cation channel subfamily V protein 5
MLKWFPKLLNDIYLSEEYYGENVLHMCCVAEDASLVKWLLDIGADFHRSVRMAIGHSIVPEDVFIV